MGEDKRLLVITALGVDRPGIVAQVTEFLGARHMNVEDARMATLGGEFALMMLVSGTHQAVESVQGDAASFEKKAGLSMRMKPTRPTAPAAGVPYVVRAYCMDREGVVHTISNALAQRGVSITSLESTAYSAPFSGTTLFRMTVHMNVPDEPLVKKVKGELEKLAEGENIDITMEPEGTRN